MFNPGNFRIVLTSMVIILFIASCGTDSSKKEESKPLVDSTAAKASGDTSVSLLDSTGKMLPTETTTSGTQVTLLEGYLDTLYIEKETFRRMIGRRLVLKPYINEDGRLTLYGWQTKNDDSNDEYEPNNNLKKIELKPGNASPIAFGKKSFLGGATLLRDDFLSVMKAIRQNSDMKYVVFGPAKDPLYPGQYIYKIVLTDYEPAPHELQIKSIKAITPVIVSINPSPPRNS